MREQELMLARLEELRSLRLTQEEEEVLDQFESFRSEHPFRLSRLELSPEELILPMDSVQEI